MDSNRPAAWFGRVLWLGIFVNLAFAVPALFFPEVLAGTLGLDGSAAEGGVWLRNAGMLLVVLCGFYALTANDPLGALGFARWSAAARFVAAGFWAWLILWHGQPAVLWWLCAADFGLGVALAFLLGRATVVEPPEAPKPYRRGLIDRLYGALFRRLEGAGLKWYDLWPPLLGSAATGGLRRDLRGENLYAFPDDLPDDARRRVAEDADYPPNPLGAWRPEYRDGRSPDGSYNDLSDPAMGMVGMRFGRNFPPAEVWPTVPPEGDPARNVPCPRKVSNLLLAREPDASGKGKLVEAKSLNLLAAAWIQFQNHGWFEHRIPKPQVHPERGVPLAFNPADYFSITLDPDDPEDRFWIEKTGRPTMLIRRTPADPTRPAGAGYPPSYRTADTHWWDASQIYGSDRPVLDGLRTFAGGEMKVERVPLNFADGGDETLLPLDPKVKGRGGRVGLDLTGMNSNYWFGMSALHTLFVREHNHLCGELRERHKGDLSGLKTAEADEWVFSKARLIVAALMAKIHTVEWTTAILNNPVIDIDLNTNWWGLLGRRLKILLGRVSSGETLSGIIGSAADHHSAAFSLTEDFVSVYRLHPLIPDEVAIHELTRTGHPTDPVAFTSVQGEHTRDAVLSRGLTNWFHSMGRQSPGAVTLKNYPQSLRRFERPDGELMDLATRDIVRDRERGIPLYNRFRTLLRMRPKTSYRDLVGHRPDAQHIIGILEKLYGKTADGRDNVDQIDLMVGLYAEKLPKGYGFSDTAFRIFIVMASRRLRSDRFFTQDYRPEVYTPFGIDWLNEQTMSSLIERHYPGLRGRVPAGKATFAPWS